MKTRLLWRSILVVASFTAGYLLCYALQKKGASDDDLVTVGRDYFAIDYGFVIDSAGRGVDSVFLQMVAIPSGSVLYTTHTDSTGRFRLFDDRFTFFLFDMPDRFVLHLRKGAISDSLYYCYERADVNHFERTAGPDTVTLGNNYLPHRETFARCSRKPDSAIRPELRTGGTTTH